MRLSQLSWTSFAPLTLATAVFACGSGTAEARLPHEQSAMHAPGFGSPVSVEVTTPGGGSLPTYWYQGAMYVAGSEGERYEIRLVNHTPERLEAVVTVDGRDVVSGELGNWKRQRGYVLEPWGSLSIDGFRRSLDHVAAFRFSDVPDSYSARRGTPQHVGVIGVAVFKEKKRHVYRRPRPVEPDYPPHPEPYPRPYYEPYAGDRDEAAGSRDARKSAPSTAPRGDATAPAEASQSSAPHFRSRGGSGRDDGAYTHEGRFAPPPKPQNELGTRYGETRYSSVREVEFERRARRPDALFTIHYDSFEGLRNRGVLVEPPWYEDPRPYPYQADPEPWPEARRFAPPPPPRRW